MKTGVTTSGDPDPGWISCSLDNGESGFHMGLWEHQDDFQVGKSLQKGIQGVPEHRVTAELQELLGNGSAHAQAGSSGNNNSVLFHENGFSRFKQQVRYADN